MTEKELKRLATLTAQELFKLITKNDDDIIGIREICKLTGLSSSSVYHRKENGMPVQQSGRKLVAKRSEIVKWIQTR
jgi:predicted DNA-binding transcriptional regulator AlpA